MAKKKMDANTFGLGPDSFHRGRTTPPESVDVPDSVPQSVDAPFQEPVGRERKQKRVQLLTYESLINEMDEYAKKQGVSRAAVFEAAVNMYLDKFAR